MKRKISLLLSLVLLVTVFIPVQIFAQSDKELMNAITIAKEKFDIPEGYEFNYSVYTEYGKRVWYLSWTSKDVISGSIEVNVDEKGTIISYSNYKPRDYSQGRKLPKLDRNNARQKAEEFIKKVNPGILPNLQYHEVNQNSLVDYSYSFTYHRMANNIPLYANCVTVSVHKDTGEIVNYRLVWDDSIKFPVPDGIITMEQAEEAYGEKLGLKLIYNYAVDGKILRIYPVYIPVYSNYEYGIDALTGEKIQLGRGYITYDSGSTERAQMAKSADMGSPDIALTPEEMKAVEEMAKVITVEKAEKIARSAKLLELTNEFTLEMPYLSRGWPDRDEFFWYLDFVKQTNNKNEEYYMVSCSINAITGEIISFYKSLPYKAGSKPVYDEKASRAEVEKFIKEFKPEKFNHFEFDEDYRRDYPKYGNEDLPMQYRFSYVRKVNGVHFPGNKLNIGFDAVSGKVYSFSMSWFDREFPPVDKVLSIDDVHENLFKNVGMELQYAVIYQDGDNYRLVPESTAKGPETRLVYLLKSGKPLNFDAYSGEILDYNGKAYKEYKPAEYTDIAGNFAEKQISILAEYGVSLGGTEFKPSENIVQKDFLILLSKTLNNYYYEPIITRDSDGKELENLYNFMIREGILKEHEKAPNNAITREEAIKYIIRALKYDKVADLKNIYVCDFKDVNDITPELVGYVAIARGFNIISGNAGNFMPKANLTRAEAAVIIYNYLQS